MVQVGIFLRIANDRADEVTEHLSELGGIQMVPLETPGTLGAVLSADDLDAAEARLTQEIRNVPGVLCAWPVHAALDGRSPEGAAQPDAAGVDIPRRL